MLEVRNLTKRYGAVPAVKGVSFVVRPAEVLGYLGPNGSGKSTTVKVLAGLMEPTSGEVLFNGVNIREDLAGYKHKVGYVPEEPNLYPYLSGLEYLKLVGTLRGIQAPRLDRKIRGMLDLFSLSAHRYSTLQSYSKGMRQKILIIAALLDDPEVLIFDEPLSGLDVTSAMIFKDLVKTLASEGKVILYCSHVLEVVEKVCSQVLILSKGRCVAYDSVTRIRGLIESRSLEESFARIVEDPDTQRIARQVVDVMLA